MSAGNLSKGAKVTISGQCGNFWRIDKNLYVAKSALSIPVTKIVLAQSKLTLEKGDVVTLKI
ncbi:MAG: hypothetical protein LBT52_01405, partial [Clostridiales Family XIII bacterium]|nr:hypothetical protein [Clostridiales Family XIII bacterium]